MNQKYPLAKYEIQRNDEREIQRIGGPPTTVKIGLGWDPIAKNLEGLPKNARFDLDLSCLLLDKGGRLTTIDDLIYYHNLRPSSHNGSIEHSGDDPTGRKSIDGLDEWVRVDLDRVSAGIEQILILVTIYKAEEWKLSFSMVERAFIRIISDLVEIYGELSLNAPLLGAHNVLEAGVLFRKGDSWCFKMTANPTNGGLYTKIAQYSDFSTLNELPTKEWKEKHAISNPE